MVQLLKVGCMSLTSNNRRCNRPVQYVFEGDQGPFYRCGKCGRVLITQRDDVVLTES